MAHAVAIRLSGRTSLRPSAEPNMVPFIDVLLVLLIIFMVTAPQPTVDLNVDMPGKHTHYVPEPIRPTVVAIREEGGAPAIYVDDELVTLSSLGARTLAHVRGSNPSLPLEAVFAEGRIYVRADQSTAYSNVVDVMDALRDARFARVGIYAELAEEG